MKANKSLRDLCSNPNKVKTKSGDIFSDPHTCFFRSIIVSPGSANSLEIPENKDQEDTMF